MCSQIITILMCFAMGSSAIAAADDVRTKGHYRGSDPVAVLPGGLVRGAELTTRGGRPFHAYRGIRYARPPIGELRFKPPQLITEYEGVVDATDDGPACPLPAPPDYPVDEDCLTINVYTPDTNSSEPMPVIVYIHSGGFFAFTGRSDVAGPHYLMEKDLVLVTLNYRIATLGFLSTGDEFAPGNLGMKDQVAALRWVRQNIAAFGGDPELVTLTGCSAGSISTMLHMISPMSRGLFHRAISISGSPTEKVPPPSDLNWLAKRQAELVGCPTNNSRAIFDCLKTKPWKELADSLNGFQRYGDVLIGLWQPVIEKDFGQERFLDMDPAEAIKQGRMHAVPYIVSQTEAEFYWIAYSVLKNQTLIDNMNKDWERVAPLAFVLPEENQKNAVETLRRDYLHDQPIVNDTTSAYNLGRIYGDSIIGFAVHRLANLMCRHSPEPVYYYQFDYIGNNSHYVDPDTRRPTRAAHHDDLLYLFSMSYAFPLIPLGSQDDVMVKKMTGIWYNFAKYGHPEPCDADEPELSSLQWPIMTPEDREYLLISEEFTVKSRMDEDRFNIWEDLYPIDYE